jgi:DNA-binding MarR family transcriptional regulator
LSSPTVTQHITSLESKGFIVREIDPNDRRKIRIILTAKGKDQMKEAKQSMLESFSGLIEHLGVEKTEIFINLLNESSAYFTKLKKQGHCDECEQKEK